MLKKLSFIFKIWGLLILHNYKLAEKICKMYIENNPRESLYHEYIALIYRRTKEINKAINEYKKAIDLWPYTLTNRLDLISLLYETKRYDEVINNGTEILSKKQEGPLSRLKPIFFDTLYWYIAFSYFYLGNYKEAVKFYEKLKFTRYKNNPQLYEHLNYCCNKLLNSKI